MKLNVFSLIVLFTLASLSILSHPRPVQANHAWGPYHWARTSNPFTLKLADNLKIAWKPYLTLASDQWSVSSVLNTTIVAGSGRKTCRPTSGRIEVCASAYGNNGWLGLAQIWVSGSHITQATAKMNDTYFNQTEYNTPSWKKLVMCQEIAHDWGLTHQDEGFDNANLGTCMDYTSFPDGPPANTAPNAHDYEMMETIYTHLDSINTVSQSSAQLVQSLYGLGSDNEAGNEPSAWGKKLKDNGNVGLYVKALGGGRQVYTHVFWVNQTER